MSEMGDALDRWHVAQDRGRIINLLDEALRIANTLPCDDVIFVRMQLRQMSAAMSAS